MVTVIDSTSIRLRFDSFTEEEQWRAGTIFLYWGAGADQNRYLKSSKLYYKQYICHHMYVIADLL